MSTYLDTSALIALAASRDKNHKKATTYLNKALGRGERFVLGRPVLIEYIDGMTKRVGKRQAISQLLTLYGQGVPPISQEERRRED